MKEDKQQHDDNKKKTNPQPISPWLAATDMSLDDSDSGGGTSGEGDLMIREIERMRHRVNEIQSSADKLKSNCEAKEKEFVDQAKAQVKEALAFNKLNPGTSQTEADLLRQILMQTRQHVMDLKEKHEKELDEQNKKIEELTDTIGRISTSHSKLFSSLQSVARIADKHPNPFDGTDFAVRCHFCQSPQHSADYCRQFSTAEERREALDKEGRCYRCLLYHRTEDCKNTKVRDCKCGELPRHKYYLCRTNVTEKKKEAKRKANEEVAAKLKRDEEEAAKAAKK